MSRFTKKSNLPNLKRINSTKNKVSMLIEMNEPQIIESLICQVPIQEVEAEPIIKPFEIEVVPKEDESKRIELKRKRSRELFQITVQQILLNKRKEKIDGWEI